MTAVELMKSGDVDEALASLMAEVRRKPADADSRIFLFQLFAINGEWERALRQLSVAADLGKDYMLLLQAYRPALICEAFREKVFAGEASPMIFGKPPEWIGGLAQALVADRDGDLKFADSLRQDAFGRAEARPGTIGDKTFDWLADADPRLGPVTEALIEGAYYWLPLERVAALSISEPSNLRDAIWTPCHLVFTNGGSAPALIPTRYPGSSSSSDGAIRLGRKTDWVEQSGQVLPVGQRMLATDEAEYALMDVRDVVFEGSAVDDSESVSEESSA